jgi:hypothetical protein
MQKWDYLFIEVDDAHGTFGGLPRLVNGQELPNWEQGESIFGAMIKLAWKGWEPVGFGLGYPLKKDLLHIPMIFRRPKA